MQGVFAASIAVFVQFKTVWIIPLVLLRCIVTLLAVIASEVNCHANVFLSHNSLLRGLRGPLS